MNIAYLPSDVLEHIFSYLDITDILNVSSINDRFDEIATGRRVIRTVKIKDSYNFDAIHIQNFFGRYPVYENITCFYIISLYWIPAADLRNCIKKMVNLERLAVVDTKLSLKFSDLVVYIKLQKLQRLSVGVQELKMTSDTFSRIRKLTHIYLYVSPHKKITQYDLCSLNCELTRVRNLKTFSMCYLRILNQSTVMDFFTRYKHLENFAIHYLYSSMHVIQDFSYLRERAILPDNIKICSDENWKYLLKNLQQRNVFSMRQYKQLIREEQDLETIHFDEINFSYGRSDDDKFYEAVCAVLLTDAMKHLRRLTLPIAICRSNENVTELDSRKAKRQRLINERSDNCKLKTIASYLPDLEELELTSSGFEEVAVSDATLSNIEKFTKLKGLSLHKIPLHVSGAFILKVMDACKNLTSLEIGIRRADSSQTNFLCQGLKRARLLKQLSIRSDTFLCFHSIFQSVEKTNTYMGLERLFLETNLESRLLTNQDVAQFLTANEQLKFFFLCCKSLTVKRFKEMKATVKAKMDDPKKVYVVSRSMCSYGYAEIPLVFGVQENFQSYRPYRVVCYGLQDFDR